MRSMSINQDSCRKIRTQLKAEYIEDFSEKHDNIVEKRKELLTQLMEGSPTITPEEVADIVFKAIKDEKLYIFTHTLPFIKDKVKERFDAILKALN